MKGKISFLAGMALGYVLGSRAGRGSYEKITASLKGLAAKDSVQNAVAAVQKKVTTEAGEAVNKLVHRVLPSQSAGPDPKCGNNGSKAGSFEGRPLDTGPEVSDEFPDDALPGGEGQLWDERNPSNGHLPSSSE